MQVFTVRDSKAEAYLQPFFATNIPVAVRMLTDAARDPNSNLYRHSSDFELFLVGKFDEHTGMIEPVAHVPNGKVVDFLVVKQEEMFEANQAPEESQ